MPWWMRYVGGVPNVVWNRRRSLVPSTRRWLFRVTNCWWQEAQGFHHKIWSTISVARTLAQWGVPVVPVLWMATEDHDFVEVSTLWRIRIPPLDKPVRATTHACGAIAFGRLEGHVGVVVGRWVVALEFSDAQTLKAHLNTAIEANETLADLMRRWIHAWYRPYGLVVLDAKTLREGHGQSAVGSRDEGRGLVHMRGAWCRSRSRQPGVLAR